MTRSEFDAIAAQDGTVATTGLTFEDSDTGRAFIDDAGRRYVSSVNGVWWVDDDADLEDLIPGDTPIYQEEA